MVPFRSGPGWGDPSICGIILSFILAEKLSEKIAGGRQKWLNERLYFPMKEHE
jgi:hypothetical protein